MPSRHAVSGARYTMFLSPVCRLGYRQREKPAYEELISVAFKSVRYVVEDVPRAIMNVVHSLRYRVCGIAHVVYVLTRDLKVGLRDSEMRSIIVNL